MIPKVAIFFAIAFTAVISGVAFYQSSHSHSSIPSEALTMFENWQGKYGKNYGAPAEKDYRLRVFWNNILNIRDHNDSDNTYELEANQFADLTSSEFKTKYMGFRFTDRVKTYVETPVRANPPSIDWRTKGAVNPIKNQMQCGSCWAFSAIAGVEGQWFLKKGQLLSLSEQQLVDCSRNYGNQGCNGGLMDDAFKYIMAKGIETEASYPYRGFDQRCKASGSPAATISGYKDVRQKDELALETAAAGQVVSVAVDAETWQFYNRGIYDNKNCGTQLDHGVAVVGYGTVGTEQFWIVRNSWTAQWGENGYIRLVKNNGQSSGECGILLAASYPTV